MAGAHTARAVMRPHVHVECGAGGIKFWLDPEVEVANIERFGIWLLVDGREFLFSYKQYPWFVDARIGDILDVRRDQPEHLRWPALDGDLSIDSLLNPENHPLRAKAAKRARLRGRAAESA